SDHKRKIWSKRGTLIPGFFSLFSDMTLSSQLPGRRRAIMSGWIQVLGVNFLFLIFLGETGVFAQRVTTLYDFAAQNDGANPQAGVVFDQQGNLYGTTIGGVNGNGIVYSLTPPEGGGAPWTESVLHKFAGQPDGAVPVCSLTISPSGELFGTT